MKQSCMTPQSLIITLGHESFCWLEQGWVAELLNGTTLLNITGREPCSRKKFWNEGKRRMVTKQTKKQEKKERERERWKYFLLCRICRITFWPYYFLSCPESLMFNYWKHTSSHCTAKQYLAYISSRHHLIDGNIKKLLRWWDGGVCGGKWEYVQLIGTIMKPLVKAAACQDNTNNTRLIVLLCVCFWKNVPFHFQTNIKAHFIFMKLVRRYRNCYHPQGQAQLTLYYHIKTYLRRETN